MPLSEIFSDSSFNYFPTINKYSKIKYMDFFINFIKIKYPKISKISIHLTGPKAFLIYERKNFIYDELAFLKKMKISVEF